VAQASNFKVTMFIGHLFATVRSFAVITIHSAKIELDRLIDWNPLESFRLSIWNNCKARNSYQCGKKQILDHGRTPKKHETNNYNIALFLVVVKYFLDRLFMILRGEDNIREVIAFPKNGQAMDTMTMSPSAVRENSLKELGVKIMQ
jgi:hypothetical protein